MGIIFFCKALRTKLLILCRGISNRNTKANSKFHRKFIRQHGNKRGKVKILNIATSKTIKTVGINLCPPAPPCGIV